MWYLFFSVWFISLIIIISISFILLQMTGFHYFCDQIILHSMHIFFMHLLADGHLCCFHFLSVMSSAAVNVQVSTGVPLTL